MNVSCCTRQMKTLNFSVAFCIRFKFFACAIKLNVSLLEYRQFR